MCLYLYIHIYMYIGGAGIVLSRISLKLFLIALALNGDLYRQEFFIRNNLILSNTQLIDLKNDIRAATGYSKIDSSFHIFLKILVREYR
jgi:hypothetical protein